MFFHMNDITLLAMIFVMAYATNSLLDSLKIYWLSDMDTNVASHQTWPTSPEYGYKNVGSCREFTTRVLPQERGFMQEHIIHALLQSGQRGL